MKTNKHVNKLGRGLESMFSKPEKDDSKQGQQETDAEVTGEENINNDGIDKKSNEKPKTVKDKGLKAKNDVAETMVKTALVSPNPEQPRKTFDEEALEELASSIKMHGIIQPLVVTKKGNYYEIIAGERRWRAAKKAGLKEIPVIVRDYSDQEIVEISLIENIQREDLNPIEEAMAYKNLLEEYHLKQGDVAERVSKSRTAITNSMRLLKLDQRVQQALVDGVISSGHARAILAVEEKDKQYELLQYIIKKSLNVRETEKYVQKVKEGKSESFENKEEVDKNEESYKKIETELMTALNTKVSVKSNKKGSGKIEMQYYSIDDFERLVDIIKCGVKGEK